MATVRTVEGPLDPAEVTGPVLPHEHLAIDLRTEDDAEARVTDRLAVVDELRAARESHGLGLVVDQTCRGMGRDPRALVAMSRAAGVPVVASTGYYWHRFHPAGELDHDVEAVTARLVHEIRHGLDGTDVRPGVVAEVGSHGAEPSPAERTSLLAAGHAAAETGLSVGTHAHLGEGGPGQLELLVSTGMRPERVCVGHQDLADDTAQHLAIAEAGAFVAFDTVGKESYQPDAVRLGLLLALLEAGHAGQVLLSNDVSRDRYLLAHGGPGLGHVLGTFSDLLRGAGVDEGTLDLLRRRNPLRWLTGEEVA
ncbi:MAG: hypothetical protein Q7T56_19585 [Nocardioidaceae bacterium]|nr:hypothetical protein [Nocardioidaceae bacterium]